MTLLSYFTEFGNGTDTYVETLASIYRRTSNPKVKRHVVKTLGETAEQQSTVIDLLAACAQSSDTPLALNCLGGLQLQAKTDPRAWKAVENSIESSDPDVLHATLDVINALAQTPNQKVSARIVQIVAEASDEHIREKGVLALGICGTKSKMVVDQLKQLLAEPDTAEGTKVAAALVLGLQAEEDPEGARVVLSRCKKEGESQSLRSACVLGLEDLKKLVGKKAKKPRQKTARKPPPKSSRKVRTRAKKRAGGD